MRKLAKSTMALVLTGLCSGLGSAVHAQEAFLPPNPTAPKTEPPIDARLIPWIGVWRSERPLGGAAGSPSDPKFASTIPFTPEWQKKRETVMKLSAGDLQFRGDVDANPEHCIPSGMPMMMTRGFELFARPGVVTIVKEAEGIEVRRIWVDGRQHTPDEYLLDSFAGETVGHWEGDTLVTDTIGLVATNEIAYGIKGTKMHVVERWHQVGPREVAIETSIDDPKALSKPWVSSTNYRLTNEPLMLESYCIPAMDRSVDPATGRQTFDLTPPTQSGINVTH